MAEKQWIDFFELLERMDDTIISISAVILVSLTTGLIAMEEYCSGLVPHKTAFLAHLAACSNGGRGCLIALVFEGITRGATLLTTSHDGNAVKINHLLLYFSFPPKSSSWFRGFVCGSWSVPLLGIVRHVVAIAGDPFPTCFGQCVHAETTFHRARLFGLLQHLHHVGISCHRARRWHGSLLQRW